MRKPIAALLGIAVLVVSSGSQSGAAQTRPLTESALRKGFQSPPQTAKLWCYWWWLNGNTTEATITNDLTEMSRKGYGGVLLIDANGSNQNGNDDVPHGPDFGSPAWTRLYLHALKTAATLHLQVTLNILSGWNLGGPDVTPADASKALTWSRQQVDAAGFDGQLQMPPIQNGFYGQIAVLAYPLAHGPALAGASGDTRAPIRDLRHKTAAEETGMSMPHSESLLQDVPATPGEQDTLVSSVINISSQVDATGHLHWTPPSPGPWEILRIGYTDTDVRVSTSSDGWQGLAIDYLDHGAFDHYWDHTLTPLLEAARPYLKTTLVNLATDSWEVGGTNWTGGMAATFQRSRGYDPIPYLPIIAGRIVDDRATSNRFLNDLRRTVGDLITDHYDHFAARAKVYGLGIECESGGPQGAPLDALETFRNSATPQTEYWAQSEEHRPRDEDRYFTKEVGSAADIYGKRFAADEGMTSIGPQWSESPATDLKPSFDRALTEGMNRLVWHEFTSSPASYGLPGNEFFAGTHMNPRITWWPQSVAFFQYLNRSQFLLQQGHSVDDVLYFYGDEVPNFVRLKQDDPARILPGYDYDVTGRDALLHSLSVRNGVLSTPAGNPYRVLVMPIGRHLDLASLERIADYVHHGGSLAGMPPLGPTGIVDDATDARFSELSHALWDGCGTAPHVYGKGLVYCGADTRTLLQHLKLAPDFDDPSGKLDFVHRATAFTDIYFVRNATADAVDTTVRFRIAGRAPELWNALDGSVTPQREFAAADGVTSMPLHVAPYGSTFVVFAHAANATNIHAPRDTGATPTPSAVQELTATQWTIAFQPGRGAPVGPQPLTSVLSGFQSWSQSTLPGVRYFSGTATYRTAIDLHPQRNQRVRLSLAGLHEVCTVRVNGKTLGTLWAMPYSLDITAGLRDGSNTIELDVTNLWPNRIIGDAQPNVTTTYTRTNIRKYNANSPLLPSGLTGPVTLETFPVSK